MLQPAAGPAPAPHRPSKGVLWVHLVLLRGVFAGLLLLLNKAQQSAYACAFLLLSAVFIMPGLLPNTLKLKSCITLEFL